MKNNFFKKSLVMISILLITSCIIPELNGNILKINSFENKMDNDFEYRKDSILPNLENDFSASLDSFYFITDRYGFQNYSNTHYDSNNNSDDFQNVNIRKIDQKNNLYLKKEKIDKNYDSVGFDEILQKSFLLGSGNVLYVGGGGPNNYSSIQDAINDSEDGDTVFVFDDSSPYYENIVIDKSINLIGENKETTEINGSKLNEFLDTINISANNVYVNGFSINNNLGYYYQAAINILTDYVVITNCKIYNNEWIGISLFGSSNSQIFDCELFNNLMAIHLVDSDENEINTCYCYANAEDIILFENSNFNKIINCTCNGNSFSGIHVQRSNGNQVINCTCTSGYSGITLAFAPNSMIHGNILNNNYENFGVSSSILSDFYCDIDITNKINGKPIYYFLTIIMNKFH